MLCKTVFTISGESREVTFSCSKMLEKSSWTSSFLMQLLFRSFFSRIPLSRLLLLLHFRFPRPQIFQNTYFSLSFMVAGVGITRQLTWWEPVVSLTLFTFLVVYGCWNLRKKNEAWCLWNEISSWPNTFREVCSRLDPWNLS